MTCPNCGHRARDGAKFCDECGIVLPDSTATPDAPRPVRPIAAPRRLEPVNVSPEAAGNDPSLSSGGLMPPPVDINRARRIFSLVALGLVAVLCFCCALAIASLAFLSQNPLNTLMPTVM
jgi:zinc-ribbon domain